MASVKTLKKTQILLQAAHDSIEVDGFDIGTYRPWSPDAPACCYIGTVRKAAGVDPDQTFDPSSNADTGDGPELTLALEVLDKVASEAPTWKKVLGRIRRGDGEHIDLMPDNFGTGRTIEALGLERNHSKREALIFFRRALTDIHNQLEAKGA